MGSGPARSRAAAWATSRPLVVSGVRVSNRSVPTCAMTTLCVAPSRVPLSVPTPSVAHLDHFTLRPVPTLQEVREPLSAR